MGTPEVLPMPAPRTASTCRQDGRTYVQRLRSTLLVPVQKRISSGGHTARPRRAHEPVSPGIIVTCVSGPKHAPGRLATGMCSYELCSADDAARRGQLGAQRYCVAPGGLTSPMRRVLLVAVVGVAALTAACTGGNHDASPITSRSASTTLTDTSTPASPTSARMTSTVPRRSGSRSAGTVPTPSVTPPAQGAVDAYVADFDLGTSHSRDPANANLSWIARYETGKVKKQTVQSFAYMKTHGLAYRGATPDPNVKVQSVLSSSVIVLTSCLIVSKADPWTQYVVATGKPVSSPSPRNPPPPYLLRIYMKANAKGAWQIENVLQDTSKTCKG